MDQQPTPYEKRKRRAQKRTRTRMILACLCAAALFACAPLIWQQGQSTGERPAVTESPDFKGILYLWHCVEWDPGASGQASWIKKQVARFERRHPGVLIEVRVMTREQIALMLQGDAASAPDILSFSPGVLPEGIAGRLVEVEAPAYPLRDELLQAGREEDRQLALPLSYGAYALLGNEWTLKEEWAGRTGGEFIEGLSGLAQSLLRDAYALGAGLNNGGAAAALLMQLNLEQELSAPLLSPTPSENMTKLAENKLMLLCGGPRELLRLDGLHEQGKAMEAGIAPLSSADAGYTDLTHYIAAYDRGDAQRESMSVKFINSLFEEIAQAQLSDLYLMPARSDIALYTAADTRIWPMLEGLPERLMTCGALAPGYDIDSLHELARRVLSGESGTLEQWRIRIKSLPGAG